MIVCVCQNVNDRAIAAAAESGAKDVHDVARATGAGTLCGCCHETIAEVLGREKWTPCKSTPCAGCPRAASAGSREAA
jgi:bacterioferritin-associated ferredoxin